MATEPGTAWADGERRDVDWPLGRRGQTVAPSGAVVAQKSAL